MTPPKTAEEIMGKHFAGTSHRYISEAMQEFAAQQSRSQAIAFAEWIHRHAHWQHNGQWSTDVNAQRAHNAKQLFEIYQQFLIEQAKKEI